MKARAYLYRNLHKNAFSIRFRGHVVLHTRCVVLYDVLFKVSEVGRQRVLTSQQKNVHATLAAMTYEERAGDEFNPELLTEIWYNPYTTDSFVVKETGEAIHQASEILCLNNKVYLIAA